MVGKWERMMSKNQRRKVEKKTKSSSPKVASVESDDVAPPPVSAPAPAPPPVPAPARTGLLKRLTNALFSRF